ncbi:MAG: DNA gyrase subunit A [Acidimicrobiales bacterium]|nr:DNA gyrase subunit A [Acidimicrobiales bacterium]
MTDLPPNDPPVDQDFGELPPGIEPIEIQDEMEASFLEYAMSVIVARALPDARDGLKPVHRRILWAMFDGGHTPARSHVKCATVVGSVIGNYHPHGDSAIYEAMVRMGQDFSLRHTLVDPHGNFGSPEFPPAAYRYTECRLTKLAMQMVAGIEEDTVDLVDNFDGKKDEPIVLPSRFPNLLVNGSQGIAVGMATNIPPHNLGETIDATIHLIDNPDATPVDLHQFILGPDFPTGALILGRSGIYDAYTTGKGSVKMRAVTEVVEAKSGPDQIVVTEIPYQTSVEQIARKAAEIVERGDLDGIREIRNESSGEVTRLVFDLKRDATASVVLNNLFKFTPMQSTFSANMVALVDGVPRTLNLRELLVAYVDHQREVITRRTQFRLDKKKHRSHVLEGLIRARDVLDEIIALIRASDDRPDARAGLEAEPFSFSPIQADAILDMQLGRLTRLARINLEEELAALAAEIVELEAILADPVRRDSVIKEELQEIKEEFATPRISVLQDDPGEMAIEDLIDDEEVIISLTASGYVKAVSVDEFRAQARGGRGVTGAKLKDDDEDLITHLLQTSAYAYLLFFSNLGKVYRIKAYQIPPSSRTSRGMALVNLLQLEKDEKIQAIIDTRDYETSKYLFFATRMGRVKKTVFNAYDSNLKAGLRAIKLNDGDELVDVVATNGVHDIFMVSEKGQALRFKEDQVRAMGRTAAGVLGMKFRPGDRLVSMDVYRPEAKLLVITNEGFGKRVDPDLFTPKNRAGLGVRAVKVNDKKGLVVGAMFVTETDQVMLISTGGVVIRLRVGGVSEQGRDATGVTVMSLSSSDQVSAVARILESPVDEDNGENDGVNPSVIDTSEVVSDPEDPSDDDLDDEDVDDNLV